MTSITGDVRETMYLLQQLYAALQMLSHSKARSQLASLLQSRIFAFLFSYCFCTYW